MTARCELRHAARESGHVTYTISKPCRHGHQGPRFTSTGGCVQCTKRNGKKYATSEKGVAYRKQWRAQPHVRERDCVASIKDGKKRRYGLEWDEFQALLERAENKCEVCLKLFMPRDRRNAACVDHDHATGEVRGLLCHSCNRAMGLLKDDPAILRAMLEYLGR